MSIFDARTASSKRLFQPSVARAIAAQLIQAVAFLHSRGVIHSQLHESNILLKIPKSIDRLPSDKLYKEYGYPDQGDGVVPAWLWLACDEVSLDESEILLSDFGKSFISSTTVRPHLHVPHILRSPEQFFEPSRPLSFPADIWALACAVFAILGQRPLFNSTPCRLVEELAKSRLLL
ncbi:kinase-like domain-containing protein [Annulohypoxylon moriforme]|nr:kinase-like domain-containing protein [Annulohypoxylon moriforme]